MLLTSRRLWLACWWLLPVGVVPACGGSDDPHAAAAEDGGGRIDGTGDGASPDPADGATSGGNDGQADGAPQASPTAACLDLLSVLAQRDTDCGVARNSDERPTDVEVLRPLCPALFFGEGSSFDLDAVVACTEARRAQSCVSLKAKFVPEACAKLGLKPEGAPCQFDSACTSGACSAEEGECGVCATVLPLGAGCAAANSVVTCGINHKCSQGVCKAIEVPAELPLGSACTASDTGLSCPTDAYCTAATPLAAVGTCTQRVQVGAECPYAVGYDVGFCSFGAFCDKSVSGAAGTCSFEGSPCAGGRCAKGFHCALNNRCTAKRPVGGACINNPSACLDGLTCKADESLCVAGAKIGEPCGSVQPDAGYAYSVRCEVGAACVHSAAGDGTCVAIDLGLGASCDSQHFCAAALACTDGSCSLATCAVDGG